MITISSNADQVLTNLSEKISRIDGRRIAMAQATWAVGAMRKRIHVDGEASDGEQIGIYSDGYMKVRTNSFTSKNYTKGKNKGKPRKTYNVKDSDKVILRLTGQMKTNMKVFPLGNGAGIGFDNDHDFQKSLWVEETYKKPIYRLTDSERETVMKIADIEVKRMLT